MIETAKKATAGVLSVQFEPVLNDVEANLKKVEKIVEDAVSNIFGSDFTCDKGVCTCNDKACAGGTEVSDGECAKKPLDLIVLPEFFTTGVSHKYVENPNPKNGGRPIEFMAELAKKYNVNIAAGTVITEFEGKLYNTLFVLNRKGETVAKYDKIHLFKYFGGTENERVTPGNSTVTVDLDFAKIGLAICFDIKYPLHYKKLTQEGAEIIVEPAAWAYLKSVKGQKTQNATAFEALSIARANENLVYFVSSNECGDAGPLGNTGGSKIISPLADILADAGENEGAIYAELDLELVRELKKTTPMAFED